jgi:hypothetical protein
MKSFYHQKMRYLFECRRVRRLGGEMTENLTDRGIEILSSHFDEFDSSFLNEFPISILIRIPSNSLLHFKNLWRF